jgi:hypothetical protein
MATIGMRKPADLKREQVREQLWPGSSGDIFDRTKHDGFSTVPRILSLILGLIERLSDKGKNSSRVYCELWFRAYDDKLIEVRDEQEIAFASGLTVRRWKERIAVLQSLGFIRTAPAGNLTYGNILLRNPYVVVKELNDAGQITDQNWLGAYTRRASEIGYKLP